jgi:hypothetical protein
MHKALDSIPSIANKERKKEGRDGSNIVKVIGASLSSRFINSLNHAHHILRLIDYNPGELAALQGLLIPQGKFSCETADQCGSA